MAEYGLLDSDVIFIEVLHNDAWVFEFDPQLPRHVSERVVEPANYHRYWEVLNRRPFSSNDSKVLPVPEYGRIMQCLKEREETAILKTHTKVETNNEPNNGTSEANATNETSDAMDPNKDIVDNNTAESPKMPLPVSLPKSELSTSNSTVITIVPPQPVPEPINIREEILEPMPIDAAPDPIPITTVQLPLIFQTDITATVTQPEEAVKEEESNNLSISIDLRTSNCFCKKEPDSMPEASSTPLVMSPTHVLSPSADASNV